MKSLAIADLTAVTVAVLFARHDSVYKSLPGTDVWDETRDALKWLGGAPVACHPPCGKWGRLRKFSKAPESEKDLGRFAVRAVRSSGGVLEHPALSTLWGDQKMPAPSKGRDEFGGYTISMPQWWFGHRANKASWFYIVECEPAMLPEVTLKLGEADFCIRPSKSYPRLPSVTKPEREHTPLALAEWLLETARRCKVPVAQTVPTERA